MYSWKSSTDAEPCEGTCSWNSPKDGQKSHYAETTMLAEIVEQILTDQMTKVAVKYRVRNTKIAS